MVIMNGYKYSLKLSDCASTHINILRVFSIQTIAFCHGLENIAAIPFDNPVGVSGFTFLMLISGLLIANSVLKNRNDENYDFKRYFLRRFARIYPVLSIGFIIIILFEWLNGYSFLKNIDTFFMNILLLNNSALGYDWYGMNRHLWFLPLFWYMYLTFGWLLLGKRTVKNKVFFAVMLTFFLFIIFLILFGTQTTKKINYLVIWVVSACFIIVMDTINKYIKNKSMEDGESNKKKEHQLQRKIKYLSLSLSILFFALALSRGFYFNYENPYELVYNLFLTISVLFFLLFSQHVHFQYNKKVKKAIEFLANYSFSLFLIHFTFFNLLLEPYDSIFYYFYIYFIVNCISLGIAYFTEFRFINMYRSLLKVFHLEE